MVAKTFAGLEDVLRDELISLGAENVEMGRRMVSFEGDLEMMYKANLCCRTALRILKPIEKFTAYDPDELYDIVREIEWEKYMTSDTTFAIETTVNSEEFTHSRYVTYRVKDGIADHFQDREGKRPSIRLKGADLLLNVHIDGDRVTISLDSSGEPLSKRGYRVEQTEAPINEVLAAGIILKTGWRGDCNFADPMCGSGTFLIEGALIAANINPGIYREEFAFEKWPDFDADLFESLYNDDSGEREFNFKIYGGDIDPEAVTIARKNIKSAQVENMIELTCRPMSDWTENPEPGIVVMNPPYGQRLKPDDLDALFKEIGRNLKRNFTDWTAWIIGPDNENFDYIGLKPTLKLPLLNGSLECSLREFELFGGRYNDFRADGKKLSRNEDPDGEEKRPRKMRRISDDEWKQETRKFGGERRERRERRDRGDKRDRGEKRVERGGERGERGDYSSSRSKSFDDRDRKSFGDRDRKPYGDRDRKPYGDRDRKSYGDRDRKPYGDRDRKPYGDRDRKPYGDKRRDAKTVKFNGPQIPEDKAEVISTVHMRKRKSKENSED